MLIALMAVMSLGASAQVEQGLRFGVQGFGGANSITEDGTKAGASYGGGIVLEYGLNNNLYIGSGLNFQAKTWKLDVEDAKTIRANYLTLPIHIGYRFNVTDAAAIHFQAGPQLAYGIAGTKLGTVSYSDWAKPFEVGLGLKIGTEINKNFQINVSTNYGLTNCVEGLKLFGQKFTDDFGHNLDFTVGVAYMFK